MPTAPAVVVGKVGNDGIGKVGNHGIGKTVPDAGVGGGDVGGVAGGRVGAGFEAAGG